MTRQATYLVGQAPRFAVTFDVDGILTNPTATTFRVRAPDGTVTSYVYGVDAEVVRDATGVFHVDLLLSVAGFYTVRWEGTGAAQAAAEYQLRVTPSAFS